MDKYFPISVINVGSSDERPRFLRRELLFSELEVITPEIVNV
jgi:hypothetical protein